VISVGTGPTFVGGDSGDVFRAWVDGRLLFEVEAAHDGGMLTWTYLFIGGDYYEGNGYVHDIDEYYLGRDRARVVATDTPSYAEATSFAIQPVTAWTSSAITFAPNLDAFDGAAVYLHVFDADDVELWTGTLDAP
ncbi:MAG: hypothetical protein KC619_33525, partial [Myxococcales bacterium]|nr:hypothetical protein [Myxococcales bacterium]